MTTQLLTIGDLSRELGVDRHKIDYILSAQGIIPAARVSRYRAFTRDVLPVIRAELDRIEAKHQRGASA